MVPTCGANVWHRAGRRYRRYLSPHQGRPLQAVRHDMERSGGFSVGTFLDFVWLTIRAEGPHGGASRVRGRGRRAEGGEIELTAL